MLFRARILLPIHAPPILDGMIWAVDGVIRAVGRTRDIAPLVPESAMDLGDVILMPGLVNAHCHLDYTDLMGKLPPPSGFTAWVQQLIALKAGWSYTEFAQSWLSGLRQLTASGTTTVGNIEAAFEILPDVLPEARVRVVSFREMITIRSRHHVRHTLDEAISCLELLPPGHHRPGLSPHAPYTTSQELVRLTAEAARARGWPWTMHVAESSEEQEFFTNGRGAMHVWLRNQRDLSDTLHGTPIEWLLQTGAAGPDLLIAHANCISQPEIEAVAATGAHIVHCPRSHDYFQHPRFPYDDLARAGVNIALGTDSLASIRTTRKKPATLDLFEEMRAFSKAHPGVSPSRIVHMATLGGARALGLGNVAGQLREGSSADWILIPFSGGLDDCEEHILHHPSPPSGSCMAGSWVVPFNHP